jgi:hypothetical protein
MGALIFGSTHTQKKSLQLVAQSSQIKRKYEQVLARENECSWETQVPKQMTEQMTSSSICVSSHSTLWVFKFLCIQ